MISLVPQGHGVEEWAECVGLDQSLQTCMAGNSTSPLLADETSESRVLEPQESLGVQPSLPVLAPFGPGRCLYREPLLQAPSLCSWA